MGINKKETLVCSNNSAVSANYTMLTIQTQTS